MATVPTRFWHPLDDGRVQCDVCPRACKLHEGQRGFCFVRGREDGAMVLTTYGPLVAASASTRSRRSRSIISTRARASCRSARPAATWAASSARTGTSRKSREVETLSRRSPRPRPSPQPRPSSSAAGSVAFTYNDPVIWARVRHRHRRRPATRSGVKTVAVTAGYITPEARGPVLRVHGCGQRRSEGVHRGLLPQRLRCRISPPCSTRSPG